MKSGIVVQLELDRKVCEENGVSSSGENISIPKQTSADSSNRLNFEVIELRGKVERLNDQNVASKSQNDSLQLEIENMHMQNENLKNIIEIGKSTVETAKKISQDLSEENKLLKQKEKENLHLMQRNDDLKKIKFENQSW